MCLEKTRKTLRGAVLWVQIWTQDLAYKEVRLIILEKRYYVKVQTGFTLQFRIWLLNFFKRIKCPAHLFLLIRSASLRDGQVGVPAPGGSEIFRAQGPPSFLYNWHRASFHGVKTAGAWRWPAQRSSMRTALHQPHVDACLYVSVQLYSLITRPDSGCCAMGKT